MNVKFHDNFEFGQVFKNIETFAQSDPDVKQLISLYEDVDLLVPGGNRGDGLILKGFMELAARNGVRINSFRDFKNPPLIICSCGSSERDLRKREIWTLNGRKS